MAAWTDGYWWSKDALRLHYRDYAGPSDKPPIICIPGLTRNARDFAALADRLAGDWRLICIDLRGRGESAYAKDPLTYVPLTYLQDIEGLIAELNLTRFIVFGTSLGGVLTMLVAMGGAERIAGALINDVGPELPAAAIARIQSYVGKQASWPTWLHAARALRDNSAAIFPEFSLEDWIAQAKRTCRLTPAGRVVFDYDMRIAEPFRLPGGAGGGDLWPAFDALRNVPLVLVRGALSDLLSEEMVARMAARHPGLDRVTIPQIGHAPLLTEPLAEAAIDRLLARITG